MYDAQYGRSLLISFVISGVAFLVALILQRRMARSGLGVGWRWPVPMGWTLAGACGFLGWFVVHFGRRQFGGFDYNVLMELGWRQILGQRPYTDFPASTPPGFNLGIKFAYELFGVRWDANLYLTAIFACVTFLWIYWLLVRLALGRAAAFWVAFAIESAAMLTLCFWWYNNTTLMLAGVFFLSALLCAEELIETGRLRGWRAQGSFVISLAALSLFKPNVAGLVMVAGIGVVGIAASRKARSLVQVMGLTVGAAGIAIAVLVVERVSIPTLIGVYRNVAGERGFGLIGFHQMHPLEQMAVFYWLPALSIPFVALGARVRSQVVARSWRGVAASLFLLVGPVVAFYGAATNGEFRDVEITVLLASGGVIVFGMKLGSPGLRRVYVGLLAGGICAQIYLGAIRLRVDSIGPHMFFEWTDNDNLIPSGVLKNMRVSGTMMEVEREVTAAKDKNPGPYYLGPRVDFNYSVLGLASPIHLPAWWHPGTAFARARVPELLGIWEGYKFQTLIYLKDDYTYYPDEFMELIEKEYTRDDRWARITVYHRKMDARASNGKGGLPDNDKE